MLKVTFKTTKSNVERYIPTRWEEVTFKHYLDMQDAGDDYVKVLSVFTGMPEDVVRRSAILQLESVIQALSFIYTTMPMQVPQKILGYEVPKDLGFKSIAQFQDLREDMKEKRVPIEQIKRYPLYCATYAMAEYDWRKAEEMQAEFLQAPAPEVIAIGNFTLRKLVGLRIGKQLNFPKQVTRVQRWKLALKGWLIRLDFLVLLSRLKKRVGIKGIKY